MYIYFFLSFKRYWMNELEKKPPYEGNTCILFRRRRRSFSTQITDDDPAPGHARTQCIMYNIIRYYYSDNAKQARHVPAQYGISYCTNIHIVYVNAEVTLVLLPLPGTTWSVVNTLWKGPANARAPNNICMNPFVDTSRALAYIGPE
jgi:hypothetical protein